MMIEFIGGILAHLNVCAVYLNVFRRFNGYSGLIPCLEVDSIDCWLCDEFLLTLITSSFYFVPVHLDVDLVTFPCDSSS